MMNLLKDLEEALVSLRQTKPLVLCLTNFVTMEFMANSLLASGAAPLMSQAMDEMEELITISQVVNINLGTLDHAFYERALESAKIAKSQNKPVVLDPVGAGASRIRTSAAKSLLPHVDIIRGNASEILALSDEAGDTKGVESARSVNQAMNAAQQLAVSPSKIVVVSGPVDFITDGRQAINLPFGSPLMPLVTGMGCTLTAVIAAFAAIGLSMYQAALLATAYFGLCGQLTQHKTQGPGGFRQVFIDKLYKPDWELFGEWIAGSEIVDSFNSIN
ncbi:hydroxyethylthiazole kinase [Legionella feeleii]|uniref:Hydroxyethylthiazole kinase n=1 Tax=Legionella feeleii TaxID=453 RepID=A0A0W0TJZ6_9GAMM|nr:hydroxyethylthiazole kinase [Legionella feeleii]KTC95882.1 hydroxyethylthiazole kinase [Legionella feeleii]SPX60359.1 hydroxyethylthiazole kinase [Legionella feeleii]